MNEFPTYKTVNTASLIPYARNSRTHSEQQISKIAASIKEFGFLNPVIIDGANGIVAGHGRVMAAQKLGMEELPVIEASHLSDAQRRAYVIADNRLALDAGWDEEMLAIEFEELKLEGFDLELTGFNTQELADISEGQGEADENPYTKKVSSPVYEPTGEKPEIIQMYDRTKTEQLLAQIHESDLPDDLRHFLVSAAHRHTVFNYQQIAEFYAHADSSLQGLMENSALVIIDFEKAIADGYVKLNQEILEIYLDQKGEKNEE